MFQVQLANKIVEWERKLQMEKERQDNLNGKPYEKPTTAVSTSSRKERKFNLAQRFRRSEGSQSAYDPRGEAEFS